MGCMVFALAQNSVSGVIRDDAGAALVGATVRLSGTGYGSVSDATGEFRIGNVPSGNYVLEVSFVGFETHTEELEIADNVSGISVTLIRSLLMGEEIFVYATRANENTPTTFSNISGEELTGRNLGQDLPILLNYSPSIVTTSDAGGGVGYTGMRIRGSDATRINVTINGIPLNDSESHGVFWVNMPDFASSVENIQIQRGVGTSSNGAAAFGATVNLRTNAISREPFAQVDNSAGSFGTLKNTVSINTGLINDKFNFEGRLSKIVSDGYIDRSSSDLKSFFLSGGYFGDRTLIKALAFGGKEITQQAWYGTPEARLKNDQAGLQDVVDLGGEYSSQEQLDNLMNSDRRFNYYLYENEIDNYAQDHYQLLINQAIGSNLNFAGALHYTYGRGYFEQFRNDDDLADYRLSDLILGDTTITSTDLIRRRWLDNDFYGFTYALNYNLNQFQLTLGGGYNVYDGDHFGEIIWARYAVDSEIRDHYYDGNGRKKDFNSYLKGNLQLSSKFNIFADLQLRTIDYSTSGIDNDLTSYDTGGDYIFFNPKLGLSYYLGRSNTLYASYSIGNREPVRSDFIDALDGAIPKPETLRNLEVGVRRRSDKFSYEANYYLMNYKNQLVLTGALNDVGAAVRANVPESYRMGVEFSGAVQLSERLRWAANLTLSQNKISEFTEVLYDYAFSDDRYIVENTYTDTDISFSPGIIAGSDIEYQVIGISFRLLSKYVGQQYLDNTGNKDRSIDDYFINDLRIGYDFSPWEIKNVSFSFLINNLFDVVYESNGYTWGYLFDGSHYQQNNYYPQAGINFLAGLSLRF